jgi:hypothetical protein
MVTYKRKFLSEAPNGTPIVLAQPVPNNNVDPTFDPYANNGVRSVFQQSDG